MRKIQSFAFISFLLLLISSSALAQQNGSLSGQVYDSLGAVVVGANVIAVDANAKEKSAITNRDGSFTINGLAPGTYTVRVVAPKFALYEQTDVAVTAGEKQELTIALTVEAVNENVDINAGDTVDTDPNNNANATVLKDKDLDALPDDPDELEAALQAMAGPLAGPDGGQINIDGFTGGRIPPKEAIREIRINQNPFSAEYDRVGFGRIEILTKPGFDKFRGQAFFNFNDESLNSRNPFAKNRAPSQVRNFGGFVSGPIKAKKASYFVDVNQSQRDENAVISATILDPSLNIVNFNQDVTVPTRRFSISPRVDFAINDKNTLVARYSFSRSTSDNQGIGGFSLLSRAFDSTNTQHELNLTESMIINAKTVNETRFRYEFNKREQNGDNTIPTINVSSAFTAGGSSIGLSFNRSNRWELQNYTTTSFGKASQHAVKFGVRIRGINISDRSESNYGGTFTFSGFTAVNDPCDIVRTDGTPGMDGIVSSIEQYRCKVLGNADPRYNPNQFSLTTGNPLADVSQIDYGVFATDDWKVRQDLTLSFGLRYENQTNLGDSLNFAPRFGFAWSPGAGGARQPKTVFRGGVGVFYDRFGENFTLRENRQNGVSQLQYTVQNNPAILGQALFTSNGVSNVPTAAQLAALAPNASIPFRVTDDLQAPYSIQTAFSVERQLPFKTVLSATYTFSKSFHLLRQRNINAPVCPTRTSCPAGLSSAQLRSYRPDQTQDNVFQLESTGTSTAQMLAIGLRANISPKLSINGGYTLSFAEGNTDSLTSPRFVINSVGFPAYSYDLSNEWAPSAFNARHSLFMVGSIALPYKFRLNTIVIASTGRHFNITSGEDWNYDSLYFERPTFAALAAKCQALGLTDSFCDTSGVSDPNAIIPRNYGKGPASFNVNLNLSKTFGFGGSKSSVASNDQTQNQTPGNRRGGGGGGGNRRGGGGPVMMGGGGFFGGGNESKPYNLTLGINVQNLFNNVNFSTPVGSLTSPSFGRSRSTGGGFGFFGGGGGSANRRVDLSMRFSW
jgi:hypothetical protein